MRFNLNSVENTHKTIYFLFALGLLCTELLWKVFMLHVFEDLV